MANTDIVLRVQELRRPVIRKYQKKYEYTLNKALEECEIAWDLAYAQGDAKTMLKAVELRGKFVKLLTEHVDVTHRYGLLDDTSTEVLLAMKREFEVRLEKQKKLQEIRVVNSETVSEAPHTPAFRGAMGPT